MEAYKLSDEVCSESLRVIAYPQVKKVQIMNWHRINELYDLNRARSVSISLKVLLNTIIHSFAFTPVEKNNVIRGFFVTSDWQKDKALYQISLKQYQKIITKIAHDDVVYLSRKLNPVTGEYDITKSNKLLEE